MHELTRKAINDLSILPVHIQNEIIIHLRADLMTRILVSCGSDKEIINIIGSLNRLSVDQSSLSWASDRVSSLYAELKKRGRVVPGVNDVK